MRPLRAIALVCALSPTGVWAQETYRIEPLKEGPPGALPAAIKATLNDRGYRVLNGQGKPAVDLWLRKAVPATGKPSGPNGTVLFPILAEGELLGALRFPSDGHDFRDQPLAAGVYTLRYGLQPVNGDHLGVSPYRDFALLVAAAKDSAATPLPGKKLEEQSADAAGSSHPAVLMLLPVPGEAKEAPSLVHDESKDTWGAIFSLDLQVKGESSRVPLPLQLVVAGVAMN
jgi:hypothetical protein